MGGGGERDYYAVKVRVKIERGQKIPPPHPPPKKNYIDQKLIAGKKKKSHAEFLIL